MDSITQITLGAAVGEAVAGREAGKKAPLWGAFFGTLPDLDVLANFFLTEPQALLFHRGPSHSLLFAAVAAPLFALLLSRIHAKGPSLRKWAILVLAVLLTHIGLDCLTSYGTQIFWPFTRTPVILGTIFIIDPLYTIPLAVGLLISLRWSPGAERRRLANYLGLAVSSAYLAFTGINKVYVSSVFDEALSAQERVVERVFTKPTALNNLLWMGIGETDDGFLIGYYSILDDDRSVSFRYVPKNYDLLGDAADNPIVDRLRWFSKGYIVVRQSPDGGLIVHDLRFGRNDAGLTSEGAYIFTFRLTQNSSGRVDGFRQMRPDLQLTGPILRRFVRRVGGWETPAESVADKRNGNVSPLHPGTSDIGMD